jgi:hypothetical protein
MVELRRFHPSLIDVIREHALTLCAPLRGWRRARHATTRGLARARPGARGAMMVLSLAVIVTAALTGIASASTPPGTVIETSATLDYQDANHSQQPTVQSNIVRVLVTQPAESSGVHVSPSSASGHGSPGEVVYYTVAIANTGDGDDTFALSLSSLAGWSYRMLDDNGAGGGIVGDGIHQPSENTIIYATDSIPTGGVFTCFCAVAIPVDARDGTGDFVYVQVSSVSDPAVRGAAGFTTQVAQAPLKGQVTDRSTGHPLIGAIVNVYQNDVWVDSTVTLAPYGVYEFGCELLPGVYRVSASYPDYATQMRWDVAVSSTATAFSNFFLDYSYPEPGLARLSGQVIDAVTGRAIVGGSVLVYMGGQLIAQTTTGSQGLYDIPALPPGECVVDVVADGYVIGERTGVRLIADQAVELDYALIPK